MTGDSGKTPKIGHVQSEWPVTLLRNRRSHSIGMSGHVGAEYALLYSGNKHFWMIDHDEALPSYLSVSSSINPQLIKLIAREKSEHELYRIREEVMRFAEAFLAIDWAEIKELVREPELSETQKYFESHMTFLQNRAPHMRNILSQDLGIKQTDIEFTAHTKVYDVAKK